MELFEGGAGPSSQATRAGLVLLYAPNYLALPAGFLFDRPRLVIGREPSCDIPLPVASVSRRHATVHHDGSHWVLSDEGSRNQTHVDGEPVPWARLNERQVIRIGDAFLKFVPAGAESYRNHRIDGAKWGESAEDAAERGRFPIVGGYQISRLVRALERVAPSPTPVRLSGETGVGKEVFARALHSLSRRRGVFQAVNCAAIPQTLIEAELFGSRRGAFTGAIDRPGHIRAAHGGTLFLDEIGDMPLEAQGKLLRVLEQKEVVPVGSQTPEIVDVRVVCATHRDLPAMVAEGSFRADLLGRLDGSRIHIPPLRDRKEDLFYLFQTMLARHRNPGRLFTTAFMATLLHHSFPFNVREVSHLIEHALTSSRGSPLDAAHLPDELVLAAPSFGELSGEPEPPRGAGGSGAEEALPTEAALREILERHRGNVAAASRELDRARPTLHRWMKRYGIQIDDYR